MKEVDNEIFEKIDELKKDFKKNIKYGKNKTETICNLLPNEMKLKIKNNISRSSLVELSNCVLKVICCINNRIIQRY
jgi:hypothetical protein